MNGSPFIGLACSACALFVVVLLFLTYVQPYLTTVQRSIEAIAR